MELYFAPLSREYKITLIGSLRHRATLGTDLYGNIQRLVLCIRLFSYAKKRSCSK